MHLVQPVSFAIWQSFHFAEYSERDENKDPVVSIVNVNLNTSLKLILMTELFNRVGPLLGNATLTSWNHITVFAGPAGLLNPHVSIVVLSVSVISIFVISKLGFDVDPEFTLGKTRFHVVNVLITGCELGMDLASSVSAVALIVLGQPITGGCVLVFMVIQIAARSGVFHEQPKTAKGAPEQESQKKSTSKINADTPPWLIRDNKRVQEVWVKIPKGYRHLALKQNYFWVVQHVGHIAGVVGAPERVTIIFFKGILKLYVGPVLRSRMEEFFKKSKKKPKSSLMNYDDLD